MRREREAQHQSLSLEPGGEMLLGLSTGRQRATPGTCNVTFPLGPANKQNCTPTAANEPAHIRVMSPAMCLIAASLAKDRQTDPTANNTDDSFYVSAPWDEVRPKGCFMIAATGMYYFNGKYNWPDMTSKVIDGVTEEFKGTPICHEPEFVDADPGTSNCPKGYAVIQSEAYCGAAALCKPMAKAGHFRLVDEALKDIRPSGCHYNPAGDELAFNDKASPAGTVVGTAMCNITVTYPGEGPAKEQ